MIIIEVIFSIFIIILVLKLSWESGDKKISLHDYNFMKKDTPTNFEVAPDIKGVTKILIDAYYNLEENIHIRAYFLTTVNEIIDILGNRKVFIFNNSFRCQTLQSDITDINIEVTYTQGFKVFRASLFPILMRKLNSQDLEVYEKIRSIFNNIIKAEMSDFEKALVVHDYLILTSRYDEENYRNNTIPDVSHTPYGLLFNNKAVCSAYAEVFMIFMTMSNIECYYVFGNIKDSISGLGHAWNIVRIENQYYHIDVTFDNPVPDVIGKVKYDYFNISDELIAKTHIWNRKEYPACISMEHNYFKVKNRNRVSST